VPPPRRRRPRRLGPRLAVVAAGLGSGLAVAASMPPWGWWPAALVGLIGLDRLLAGRPAASRVRRGLLVGLAWSYPSTVWMLDFSRPGYLAAGLVFAVFVAAAALVVPPGPGQRLALPGALALAELARWSVPFGGIPLSTLPMSQAASPLAPVARLGGGMLLTLVLVTAAVGLSALLARRARTAAAAAGVVAIALGVTALVPRSTEDTRISVALVQGGGPQRTRAATSDAGLVFRRHIDASAAIRLPVDLVVWPENVVDVDAPLPTTAEGRELADLARRLGAPLVVGAVESVDEGHFTNYSAVVLPGGTWGDRYDKVLRVPFGEYVPFRDLTNALSGGAVDRLVPKDAVAGREPAVLDSPLGRLGVVISWEVFFERRVREAVTNGGRLILNPTNGSSYWLRIVQSQQVASSRLRALETDRWVVQAAPTGFSAVVDPDGRVRQRSGVGERAVLQGEVGLRRGLTPAARLGRWPWAGLALGALVAGRVIERRRRPQPVTMERSPRDARPHMADAAGGP
jgi:apolipoprotein N-acyltransferase